VKSEIKQIEEVSVTMDGEEGRFVFVALEYLLAGDLSGLEQGESNALLALSTSLHEAFAANAEEGMKK
jgi:hypothetical protein